MKPIMAFRYKYYLYLIVFTSSFPRTRWARTLYYGVLELHSDCTVSEAVFNLHLHLTHGTDELHITIIIQERGGGGEGYSLFIAIMNSYKSSWEILFKATG